MIKAINEVAEKGYWADANAGNSNIDSKDICEFCDTRDSCTLCDSEWCWPLVKDWV
ncbi:MULTISPECIES: hypothetical protein [Bacillota]|uniref:hypothetical protein n=1 Tax=Bacillota TaxID=1239 RepID=UPI000A81D9D6|nr:MULTISPECIES: hypothetical protein [Bacillota]HER5337897.1 hypothetical protein [Streptococcus pyogenes]HER5358968.1 hypothetical protein [Streptococcus pyogenes]HER5362430.1 hypothetical protein [Streptococcus pyogenes]HER5376001.1 hypothetical protein [Streptococcus pyogenes]